MVQLTEVLVLYGTISITGWGVGRLSPNVNINSLQREAGSYGKNTHTRGMLINDTYVLNLGIEYQFQTCCDHHKEVKEKLVYKQPLVAIFYSFSLQDKYFC